MGLKKLFTQDSRTIAFGVVLFILATAFRVWPQKWGGALLDQAGWLWCMTSSSVLIGVRGTIDPFLKQGTNAPVAGA